MINISINLSKLPKEKINAAKNGDKWINLTVNDNKEIDKYGNSHHVIVQQTKEEREAKAAKVYVGNGKEFVFGKPQPTKDIHSQGYNPPPEFGGNPENADDLPF